MDARRPEKPWFEASSGRGSGCASGVFAKRAFFIVGRIACLVVPLVACSAPDEPPGRTLELRSIQPNSFASALPRPPDLDDEAALEASQGNERTDPDAPKKADFEPGQGHELASIAMRNYVYIMPDFKSTRLGYLRAGTVVPRAAEPSGFKRCKGGFYRIHPRGYVCVGIGATLDTSHPIVLATARGPRRGEPFPYDYVISRSPAPHLYVRLPTAEEQHLVEGRPIGARGMNLWVVREINTFIGEADPISPFLDAGHDLPKPAGAMEKIRFPVHRGRARARSAFGLMATFDWTGRRFGLTTELDLIPLDRTRIVHPSAMRGVEFGASFGAETDEANEVDGGADGGVTRIVPTEGDGVPAFVMHQGLRALQPDADGRLRPAKYVEYRSGWVLTGRASSGGKHRVVGKPGELLAAFLETTAGLWLAAGSLRIGRIGKDLWGHAKRGKRWIDVSIELQMLVAYEGQKPVFATLVSTGRGGLADPETTGATVQGTFFVQTKHISATMDGDEASEAAFDLHDVPHVQYFHQNYAIHGAYWHNEFGKARSNGCVNVSPADAAWLFEFTDPPVPAAWHGVMRPRGGTLIYVHP